MAKFDSLMKATFNPPRNWTLLEDLKFYSDELTKDQAEMLRWCGVKVHNSTKSKQYNITIPKEYVTDIRANSSFACESCIPLTIIGYASIKVQVYIVSFFMFRTFNSILQVKSFQYFTSKDFASFM